MKARTPPRTNRDELGLGDVDRETIGGGDGHTAIDLPLQPSGREGQKGQVIGVQDGGDRGAVITAAEDREVEVVGVELVGAMNTPKNTGESGHPCFTPTRAMQGRPRPVLLIRKKN